jgi:M6 family metalloprotease-like protein
MVMMMRTIALCSTLLYYLTFSLLLWTQHPTEAIAPPHPDILEESYRHRRLHEALFPNISYTSQPLPDGLWESAIDYKRRLEPDDPVSEVCKTCRFGIEVCRYLTASQCQEIEDQVMTQAGKTRQATKQNSQIRTLAIMLLWQDQQDRRSWMTRDKIDKLWNGVGTDEIIPTGSIGYFTEVQSHGTVALKTDVVDWKVAANTEAYYAGGRSGLPAGSSGTGGDLFEAFISILDTMEAENFDWTQYDADNDGVIDHIQFLHSGYGAEWGGADCNTNAVGKDRIWAHALPNGLGDWVSAKTNLKFGAWSTSSVFKGICGTDIAELGVMMHEFYHTLGAPDLYDRDGGLSPGIGGLGAYDVMSSPYGAKNDQTLPGSMSPWTKIDLGFTQAREINTNGTYTARPSSDFPDYFIIKDGFKLGGEYLLIENRLNTGFDQGLLGNGILIYKIDETSEFPANERRGFPGQAGWPGNGNHYPIALLQADGKYDLENGKNNGDATDYFNSADQKLEPGNGELVASSQGTYPNTDGYVIFCILPLDFFENIFLTSTIDSFEFIGTVLEIF